MIRLFLFSVLCVLMASCDRDYRCECTAVSITDPTFVVTTYHTTIYDTKIKANNDCDEYESWNQSNYVTTCEAHLQ